MSGDNESRPREGRSALREFLRDPGMRRMWLMMAGLFLASCGLFAALEALGAF
ncbi:hypothetical protein [Desulfohalovibrio reitneri]|uniref:hypothetical protein n=1 Tax=Desulfohalovibrio reitneri TaxID=1307759 RepID=UPI000AD7DD52|nr:hypothetical protein [Desulfohalovibrio reitneri]